MMKLYLKRCLSVFVAVICFLSTSSLFHPSKVSAEEYEYTDPYVYIFEHEDVPESYQAFGKPLFYSSPHRMRLCYETNGTSKTYGNSEPVVFNLINTTKITDEIATTPYASTPAYCVDLPTATIENAVYQRINLEDSTYFDTETAQKLRAIYNHSFPYLTIEQLREATGLSTLTGAEAVTATQYVIWMHANKDSDFHPSDQYTMLLDPDNSQPYYDTIKENDDEYVSFYQDRILFMDEPVNWLETAGENTKKNIEALVDYLYNVTPESSVKTVISNSSINNLSVSVKEDNNGTYTITASCDITASIDSEDNLVLTANCGGQQQNVAMTKVGTYTFTFTGCESPADVNIEINGTQIGNDVYLFESYGGRTQSQTMIGYDTGILPVHAEAAVGVEDRVLKIYKTTPADEQGNTTPLPNIQFVIYQVATTEQIESGEIVVGSAPTDEDVTAYATPTNEVATITTNEYGYAWYNFTRNDMPDGVYMIVEHPTASIKAAIAPFFISIPMTNETGDGYIYEIVAKPKNEIISDEPLIDKDVTTLGQDSDTKDVGETVNWIINSYIPSDISDGISYVITDDVDSRLGAPSNIVVNVASATATDVLAELIAGTDYTATVEAIAEGGNTLTVTLTATGMKKVADAVGENAADYVIRVTFDTVLTTSATLGENIPNDATVDYTNSVGFDFTKESEEVEVHTGGLQINKVSDDGEVLAGATFKIVRAATEAELADDTIEKIEIDGVSYVYVDFYMTADMSGEKVYEVTTDENGNAIIYGLAYGDYKIIEQVAPEGYNLLRDPVDVAIGATSHLDENSIEVVNINKFTLPSTGDIGTTIFTVAGLIFICAAVVLVAVSRKSRKAV